MITPKPSIAPELKRSDCHEVLSRLLDLGYPVIEVTQWSHGRLVKISGIKMPTISAEGWTLREALESAEKEARRFAAAVVKPAGCSCSDRTCEYCVKDSLVSHLTDGKGFK